MSVDIGWGNNKDYGRTRNIENARNNWRARVNMEVQGYRDGDIYRKGQG